MTRLVCLPLDDRPVNYDYLRELAAIADIEIDLPPRQALGNPWRSSQHHELIKWLGNSARKADALLVAIDTLGYGGLIPSRTSNETVEHVLDRLSILKTLKSERPDLPILAYSVILRISRTDSSEEEKNYWGQYGKRMFRLSYLEHKSALGEANSAEQVECRSIRSQIPTVIYEDYLQGRTRNHEVNRAMLDWLVEGVFDYLILPQDDTADYGWNIAEARRLQAAIRQKGVSARAITYPGADEIGSLLLARYACNLTGFTLKVWPRFSSQASENVITSYEDRPMRELLKAHLAPLGGILAASPAEADLSLFINAPAKSQGVADVQILIAGGLDDPARLSVLTQDEYIRTTIAEMTTPQRNIEEFIHAMEAELKSGRPVALADVAFVNGADLFLLQQLIASGLTAKLTAYAGWNTAGNTLGTVLAQAVLNLIKKPRTVENCKAQLAFLFRRYLDDYYYQTLVRTKLAYDVLPSLGLPAGMERLPDEKAPIVEKNLAELLDSAVLECKQPFIDAALVKDFRVDNVHLPWQRLFEVAFDIHVDDLS